MGSFYQEFIRSTPVHVRTIDVKEASFACHSVYNRKASHELCIPENTITWVVKGQKIIEHPHGSYVLKEGNGLFLKRGTRIFSEKLWSHSGFESINLVFKDELIQEFLFQNPVLTKLATSGPIEEVFTVPANPFLHSYLHSLMPYFSLKGASDEHLSKIKYFEWLHLLLKSEAGGAFLQLLQSVQHSTKNNLQCIVGALFCQPISVEELAKECGMSLSTFKRVFQQTYGVPPKQWINQKRLELAYFYLRSTSKSIAQVGFEVGFENVSYFIQCFKAQYGFTPGQCLREPNLI